MQRVRYAMSRYYFSLMHLRLARAPGMHLTSACSRPLQSLPLLPRPAEAIR